MYAFQYERPANLADALKAVASGGQALAGGQTLIAALKQRLQQPEKLVDLGQVADLKGICMEGNQVVIGAMTRHQDVANNAVGRTMSHLKGKDLEAEVLKALQRGKLRYMRPGEADRLPFAGGGRVETRAEKLAREMTHRTSSGQMDPHLEMILADPFAGRGYGHATAGTGKNSPMVTKARKLKPEDVQDRTQLYASGGAVDYDPDEIAQIAESTTQGFAAGGLVNYDPNEIDTIVSKLKEEFHG